MPSCRITNYTSQPLNVSLKHLCALHFENEVVPGQTVKLKPGRVWFTLEVLVDNKENRYSMAQSAAAIAIISLACVGATAAVPAIAAAGGAAAVGSTIGTGIGTIGTHIAASSAGVVAVGETIAAGVATAFAATSGFIASHAAIAGTVAATFVPNAIDLVEREVGGFNNVQKEVVTILSSPNVTEDVRTQGLSLLSRLGLAVAADRAAAADAEKEKQKENEKAPASNPPPAITDGTSVADASGPVSRPTLKRMQTSVSTLLHKVSTESKERKASKKEAKAAKEAASWEVVDLDVSSEPAILSSKEKLRIHGLFMNERRHYEVREKDGKLVLMDANTREVVAG